MYHEFAKYFKIAEDDGCLPVGVKEGNGLNSSINKNTAKEAFKEEKGNGGIKA